MDDVLHKHFMHMNILLNPGDLAGASGLEPVASCVTG